ncbi:hypothetical protein ACHAPT_009479 [Fusarium lateritium]
MSRTDTTSLTTFALPLPDDAVFTFPPKSLDGPIRIVIQPQGRWRMRLHWHPSEFGNPDALPSCERVSCVSGYLRVFTTKGVSGGGDTLGRAGMTVFFEPGQQVAWGPAREDSQLQLKVDFVGNHVLWRNICSAVLDRNLFPELSSTPYWLRAIFAILRLAPVWRDKLLEWMLWIQLHVIFASNDFHIYYGRIPFTWLYTLKPFGDDPPLWAKQWTLRSKLVISWVVMKTAYWAGRIFLGMKGEYTEYTPATRARAMSQISSR